MPLDNFCLFAIKYDEYIGVIMRTFLCVVCVPLVSNRALSQSNNIDQESLQRLLSEGRVAWKEVETSTRCIDVGYEVHQAGQGIARGRKNILDRKLRYNFTWDIPHSRILVKGEANNRSSKNLRIVNPTYRFTLALEEPKPPVLGFARMIDSVWELDSGEKELFFPLEAAYTIRWILLEELTSSPDYKPLSVKRVKSPDSEIGLISLEYQHVGKSHSTPFLKGATYWALLNPNHYWLIESAGVKNTKSDTNIRQVLTYQETTLGVPFPASLKVFSESKDSREEDSYTFSTPARSVRRDAEFYLPYYGIPETVIPKIAQSRKRTLIISVCVLGLVAAVGLYYLAVRNARMKKNKRSAPLSDAMRPKVAED